MARRRRTFDRRKPLQDPGRRQFALAVLRERDRQRLAELKADPAQAKAAQEAIERITALLEAGGADES